MRIVFVSSAICVVVVFVILFLPYNKQKNNRIELCKIMNTSLLDNAKGIKLHEIEYIADCDYPRSIYVRFELKEKEFNIFKDSLDLLSCCNNNYKEKLLTILKYHGKRFWYMRNLYGDKENKDFEKQCQWWHPDTSMFKTYASYINELSKPITVSPNDRWNGRLAVQYNNGYVYILIDYFNSPTRAEL